VNRKVNQTIGIFSSSGKIPRFGQHVGGNKGVFKLSRKGPDLPGTGKKSRHQISGSHETAIIGKISGKLLLFFTIFPKNQTNLFE
jgi:hypothetical protein